MRVVCSAVITTLRSSLAAHTFDVGVSEVGDIAIVLVSVDSSGEDLHGKEAFALFFDPQKLTRKSLWLTILRVDEVTISLRAFSQKHENAMMESLKSNKYWYGVSLMTVVDPSLGALSQSESTICFSSGKRTCLTIKISHSLSSKVTTVASVLTNLGNMVSPKPSGLTSLFE